jgi:ribosomal subunit interface protein
MNEIAIKYEGIKKTEGIENRIKSRMEKLSVFFGDNDEISFSVKDTTPHKKSNDAEYEIIIEAKTRTGGKFNQFTVNHKAKDMYLCIDNSIDILKKQVSKNHQKVSHRFKHLKELFNNRYRNLLKKGEF